MQQSEAGGIRQQSEIRDKIQEGGGKVLGVYIVQNRVVGGAGTHVPFLLLDWCRGYVNIGLSSGQGVRMWRDIDRLLRFLRDELRYEGPIRLYTEGDERLARLRQRASTAPSNPPPIEVAPYDTAGPLDPSHHLAKHGQEGGEATYGQ